MLSSTAFHSSTRVFHGLLGNTLDGEMVLWFNSFVTDLRYISKPWTTFGSLLSPMKPERL
ncbi:hypothetical protein [Prochlorococcus sp. P1344]|uniref:hypothetical protein n=1 Tax=Prochlorococcus sp. P1344 TaxID=2729591 RepID=UPI00197DBDE2|nr:hypothetical protein [Prochlorococcus sp. P1344]